MSLFHDSAIVGASGQGGAAGYQISRSLRFNSSDSAYCSRVPSVAGNRKTWTLSLWLKRSKLGDFEVLFGAGDASSEPNFDIDFGAGGGDSLRIRMTTGGGTQEFQLKTTQVFRDLSSWYHILVAFDTTQSTASNRIKLYVNGSQVTAFSTEIYPSQNLDTWINATTYQHVFGRLGAYSSYYLNGYLADCYLIDGQALTPSSFTEVSATTGQLIPKAYTGTFGTNGFWLKFSDNSTAAALGTDSSGNGNTWTMNNFSVDSGNYAKYPGAITSSDGAFYTSSNPANFFSSGTNFFGGYNAGTGNSSFVWTPPGGQSVSNPKVTVGYFTAIKINGTTYATSDGNSGSSERTLSFTGTLNTLTVENTAGNDLIVRAYGFKPDGTNLVTLSTGEGNDSFVDTPTSYNEDTGVGGEVRGNYCTWNPLNTNLWASGGTPFTVSDGNLRVDNGNAYGVMPGSITVTSGKYYWEISFVGTINGSWDSLGIVAANVYSSAPAPGEFDGLYGYLGNGNKLSNTDGYTGSAYGVPYSGSDIIGVAFDADNGTLTFYRNGVSQGTAFTGINTSRGWTPYVGDYANTATVTAWIGNFGQRVWAYTPPVGFKALCDTNLTAPTIGQPSTAMDVKLWTGNGSTQTISGLGFSPDFVWIKSRSAAYNHRLLDTIRGATKELYSSTTDAETTQSQSLTAFNSDGFSLGTLAQVNESSTTFAGWCWDAGSSTVTNNAGSIASQVRANTSAGFSIVTYTGNGSAGATIGHGLGVTPGMIIIKNRDDGGTYWVTYHSALGGTKALALNLTDAALTNSLMFNNTNPTSSVFTVGGGGAFSYSNNQNGENHVAYCFAPVAGYSSFGSYTGNGSTNGPFVATGMRPKWVLIKNATSSGNYPWYLFDTTRGVYNGSNSNYLSANTNEQENYYAGSPSAGLILDMLSNGFKIRNNGTVPNNNGATYIYAAFAENPFQYARAR